MKITHVEFSALYNLGNYNNEKIGLRAQLDDGDTPEEVAAILRSKAIALNAGQGGTAEQLYEEIYKKTRELRDLANKIKEATEQWNQTAEFLRAQGLNPAAPNLPTLPALTAAPAEEEYDEIVF